MAEGDKYLDFLNETLERFVRGVSRDEMVGFELSEVSASDR